MKMLIQISAKQPLLRSAFILVALGLLAFSQIAQAVSPPPDGGYPGGNTAEGYGALLRLTTGTYNTALGLFSLKSNTTARFNTAIGAGALFVNTADQNTATGTDALYSNTIGDSNTANGAFALFTNTTGFADTAIGTGALQRNTIGGGNTAVGYESLINNTTGAGNLALGYLAGSQVTTAYNVICIGTDGADVSNSTWIDHIYGVTTVSGTTAPVIVSDHGQLGTIVSSRRFKEDIATMGKASEAILWLRPVSFHYKKDAKGTAQFGLIAEEVAEVNPDLVLPDKEGKPYTVRCDQVNAMLLNEFLKEHNAFLEEKQKVEGLEARVRDLVAAVKEQGAQIQKVSARVDASRSALQLAGSDP